MYLPMTEKNGMYNVRFTLLWHLPEKWWYLEATARISGDQEDCH